MPGGCADTGFQVNAYDGEWTRVVSGQDPRDPQGARGDPAQGEPEEDLGLPQRHPVHRSHTLLLRTGGLRIAGGPARLDAADPDEPGLLRFRYCGAAEVDGHPCIEVRGDSAGRDWNQPAASFVLYLATDRNDIPSGWSTYDNPRSTR